MFQKMSAVCIARRVGVMSVATILAFVLSACPEETSDSDGGGGTGGSGASSGDGGATSSASSTGDGGGTSSQGGGGGEPMAAPTHVGLLSIQDMAINAAPQAGHGLTVQASFAPIDPPDYEELPGMPTGCKGWIYDMGSDPPPPHGDQGVLEIAGVAGGTIACSFQEGAGYVCPTASGSGPATLSPAGNGTATFTAASASFSPNDVGRYLRISGSALPSNNGAFPIVAAPSGTTVVVVHQQAQADDMSASYVVVAGAGPIPNNPNDPINPGDAITVSLAPGGGMDFEIDPAGPIVAGDPFVVDTATAGILDAFPLDGAPVTLGCSGVGGTCGPAQLTVVRITTTDGDTTGLSPFAMPPAIGKQVDLLCATFGGDGTLVVPEGAIALLQEADAASPITRLRTAFMREGYLLTEAKAPLPPNPVRMLVGHGILGFTSL